MNMDAAMQMLIHIRKVLCIWLGPVIAFSFLLWAPTAFTYTLRKRSPVCCLELLTDVDTYSGDPASHTEPVDRQSSATPSTEIQQELLIYESPDQLSRLSKDSDIDSEEYMVMRDLKVPPGSGSENLI